MKSNHLENKVITSVDVCYMPSRDMIFIVTQIKSKVGIHYEEYKSNVVTQRICHSIPYSGKIRFAYHMVKIGKL